MTVTNGPLEGLKIIEPRIFPDDRGFFFEPFNSKTFKEQGLPYKFVQDNQSFSHKGVLRGLHFQKPPYAQGKLVRVVQGSVLDVVVDIREHSETFGQHYKIVLSADNMLSLWVPEGFAHGFVALEENTVFLYKCTDYYNRAAEEGIYWKDPDLNIDWEIEEPIISEKDNVLPSFASLPCFF